LPVSGGNDRQFDAKGGTRRLKIAKGVPRGFAESGGFLPKTSDGARLYPAIGCIKKN
jgi:hypothetical protein